MSDVDDIKIFIDRIKMLYKEVINKNDVTISELNRIEQLLDGLSQAVKSTISSAGATDQETDIIFNNFSEGYNNFVSAYNEYLKSLKIHKIEDVPPKYVDEREYGNNNNLYALFAPFANKYEEIKGRLTQNMPLEYIHNKIKGDTLVNINVINLFIKIFDEITKYAKKITLFRQNEDDQLLSNYIKVTSAKRNVIAYKSSNNHDEPTEWNVALIHDNGQTIVYIDTESSNQIPIMSSKFGHIYDYVDAAITEHKSACERKCKEITEKKNCASIKDIHSKIISLCDGSLQNRGGGNVQIDIAEQLIELIDGITNLYTKLNSFKIHMNEHATKDRTYMYYVIYIYFIAINTNNVTTYRYINKSIIQFYYQIIQYISNQFEKDTITDVMMYFKTYHWMTIMKMKNLFLFLSSNIDDDDIIDVTRTTGPIKNDITLFNNFKDILDKYYALDHSKLSTFCILHKSCLDNCLYKIDEQNDNQLVALHAPTHYKIITNFTKILTQTQYDPHRVASYLCIEEKLSKSQSNIVITYSNDNNYSNTRNQLIKELTTSTHRYNKIYVRMYEIYGKCFNYSFYSKGVIDESIFIYKLNRNGKMTQLNLDNNFNSDLLQNSMLHHTNNSDYINDPFGYLQINTTNENNLLLNFNKWMQSIDSLRNTSTRSNTSFMIYDFIVGAHDKFVGFTIIDAPVYREILSFYNKYNSDPFKYGLYTSIAFNPLFLGVIFPSSTIHGFNSLEPEERNLIINTDISIDLLGEHTKKVWMGSKEYVRFSEEVFMLDSSANLHYLIKDITTINDDTHTIGKSARGNVTLLASSPLALSSKFNDTQYIAYIAIILLRRIMILVNFDPKNHKLIEKIINYVTDTYVSNNSNITMSEQQKSIYKADLSRMYEQIYANESITAQITRLVGHYDGDLSKQPFVLDTQNIQPYVGVAKYEYVKKVYSRGRSDNPILINMPQEQAGHLSYEKNILGGIAQKNVNQYNNQQNGMFVLKYDESPIKQCIDYYLMDRNIKCEGSLCQINNAKIESLADVKLLCFINNATKNDGKQNYYGMSNDMYDLISHTGKFKLSDMSPTN